MAFKVSAVLIGRRLDGPGLPGRVVRHRHDGRLGVRHRRLFVLPPALARGLVVEADQGRARRAGCSRAGRCSPGGDRDVDAPRQEGDHTPRSPPCSAPSWSSRPSGACRSRSPSWSSVSLLTPKDRSRPTSTSRCSGSTRPRSWACRRTTSTIDAGVGPGGRRGPALTAWAGPLGAGLSSFRPRFKAERLGQAEPLDGVVGDDDGGRAEALAEVIRRWRGAGAVRRAGRRWAWS